MRVFERVEFHEGEFNKITNKRFSVKAKAFLKKNTACFIFFGAHTWLDFVQAFTPIYFYHRGIKKWVHLPTYRKCKSVFSNIEDFLEENKGQFDKIAFGGFSMGASQGMIHSSIMKNKDSSLHMFTEFDSPYRSIGNYDGFVEVTKGDGSQCLHLFVRRFKNAKVHTSKFKWYQFIKKHFYLRDNFI